MFGFKLYDPYVSSSHDEGDEPVFDVIVLVPSEDKNVYIKELEESTSDELHCKFKIENSRPVGWRPTESKVTAQLGSYKFIHFQVHMDHHETENVRLIIREVVKPGQQESKGLPKSHSGTVRFPKSGRG